MEMENKYSNIILYSYWRSSCSYRVRIALNLKNIKYDIKPINLLKSEQISEEYLEKNPLRRIPCLEIELKNENGEIKRVFIKESISICEFLEEIYPDTNLLPRDPIAKAQVRSIMSHIACNVHPIQNLMVMKRVEEIGYSKLEWAKEWITKGLEDLEKILVETRGKYCFNDIITLADAFLIPQLYNARRFGVDVDKFPNISEIEANLKDVEAFRLAAPENQSDKV
jgi:maleylacetoacetate isomerase